MDGRLIASLLLAPLAFAASTPRSWIPEPRTLSGAVTDGNPQTYELLCTGAQNDPCDIGLEWDTAQSIGELVMDYATLAGRAYEPSTAGQRLEYWTGAGWRSIPAAIEIDYRNQTEFAPLQGSGTARWTYRFGAVRTTRLRVLFTQPGNLDPGHRCSQSERCAPARARPVPSQPDSECSGP
jgi:hypothetical protein